MNTTLTALRQAMTDFLAGEGIPALTAWPREPREEGTTPVAVVQIQEVRASGGGFQNYLGQTYDPAAKTWTETYGQQVGVTFALTLYSPRQAGEAGCRALADQVAAAFPEFNVFVGGSSSFDLAPKPYDKRYALERYCAAHGIALSEAAFCGDDYGPGGNDECVYRAGVRFFKVDDYRRFGETVAELLR